MAVEFITILMNSTAVEFITILMNCTAVEFNNPRSSDIPEANDSESASGSEEELGFISGESDEDSIDVEDISLGSYYIVSEQKIFELFTDSNSSQAMECDAFGVGLDYLISEGLDSECIATDRHKGIRAELKKPAYHKINHQFDLFHVAKSIKKKLGLKAKKRCNNDISPWINCVANHLWWSSRTCGGDDVEKWMSVTEHVDNNHHFRTNQMFKQCAHDPSSARNQTDIKWLKPGTTPHRALHEVVHEKSLLKDMFHLTGFKHTGEEIFGELEAFHNMLLKFAPKRQHFSYLGMRARLQLAALDHNSNVFRVQATTKEGDPRWTAAFSKRKKDWIARKVFQAKQYGFRQDLMKLVLKRAAKILM
ncbi:Hypp9417 [Branchiostoma lanceolatum]|uniref:Hypp9417 protein n=1 Tax=Branchiostoma lanceolatum TaxID=7740 RepID=A0A8S4MMT3_BRALA|nr:Hypp9417 [Branchiostoma lanceolatum]